MRRPFLTLTFLLALIPALRAQDAEGPPEPDAPPAANTTPADEAFERFRHGTLDLATLAEVLPQLADPERRPVIRATLLEAKAPPRADLVALLKHPALAVRLGTLELLEELAGGDFAYNPWTPAESPENLGALARWHAWAGESAAAPRSGTLFSDDQRRSYLRDLLAGDSDLATRARRMLEAEGLSAVGFLETFLNDTPTLPPGSRARIREAQYQITLARPLGDQAADAARQLTFGSRDQLLSALATVRTAGTLALPILRDFITHPDPLVRETAIDALLVSGGAQAVPIIAPLLATEPDVNVIHGALRRLKDIPGPETVKLVSSFLTHPDEDLLVSAIQTSLTLSGDNERFSPGPKKKAPDSDAAILQALSDPRWRVRASALEYVTKRKVTKAKDACLALLEDPDEFVRFAAIKAIVALGAKDALPKLKAMFLANDAMAGPIIEGYGAMSQPLDAEILAKLAAAPTDARLAALRAIETAKTLAPLALRFATDPNLDVACAALRFIAAADDDLKTNQAASALVAALRSNIPEKTTAILERLNLRASSRRLDPFLAEAINAVKDSGEPTTLDPLYDAFRLPGDDPKTARPAEPKLPNIPAAQAELIREIAKRTTPDTPPGLRFNAARNLANSGHAEGYTALIRDLATFTTAQKIAICEGLGSPTSREAIQLLTPLLRDPVPEVRSAAAACALSNAKAKALVGLVLDELGKPDSRLQAHEAYCYRFEYAARESAPLFRPWCLAVLKSRDAATPLRVLAAIAARHCPNARILAALQQQCTAKDPTLRRAAWHTLLSVRPAELAASAEAIANDPAAFVRAVLPEHAAKTDSSWLHHFSDAQHLRESFSNYSEKQARLNDSVRAILRRLAEQDPSPLIRFEASFALLAQGVPIDLEAFVALLPRLSKESLATNRITEWLERNAARATPALRPLLAVINPANIRPENLRILNSRISPAPAKGFATFASLAASAATPTPKNAPVLTDEPASAPPARSSLEVVFFYKPGCPECVKAKQFLATLKTDFPLLSLTEVNILEASGTVLNQALCGRFSVPALKHSLTPAVFTQAGFVIGSDLTPTALGKLLAQTMAEAQDDAWAKLDAPEQLAAAREVERRYQAITLTMVLGGGLLDGINPCAFATIIFFLSYLQIARRSPREMLMVGAAFILAVFLAYLAAGLLLYEMLDQLNERFAGIQRWLNLGFGLLALLAAWLSLRDAFRARAGRLEAMTLQLPGLLKDRIRSVIRSGARARNFVIAAFLSGLVISLLELACTGQVYAPIIYQIQKGRLDAVLWLVIYNLAFITPLLIIFLLAYGGLRSETLIGFQKKHTFAVKLGLALLFLGLALVILLGSSLLARV
ncbi:MAG: HEAT repeat domain-containing protein [Verrucomicrobia bacterium]|nr:HEAT repeat domain-containing protein [Verrucomicrobiota bacterium]